MVHPHARRRLHAAVLLATLTSGSLAHVSFGLPFYLGPGDLPAAPYPRYTGGSGIVISNTGNVAGLTARYTSPSDRTVQAVRYGATLPTQYLDASAYGGNSTSNFYNFVVGMDAAGNVVTTTQGSTPTTYALRYPAGSASPQLLAPLTSTATTTQIPYSSAGQVNASGMVVGSSSYYFSTANLGPAAVVWMPNQTAATKLHELSIGGGGVQAAQAYSVNDAGVIGGAATLYRYAGTFGVYNNLGYRPVRWASTTASPVQLDVLSTNASGVGDGLVIDLNSSGVGVGRSKRYVNNADQGNRAVRWNAGATTAIELLAPAGLPAIYKTSYAQKINDAGTAIGRIEDPDANSTPTYASRGIRWTAGSNVGVELRAFGYDAQGRTYTNLRDINSLGNVVGNSTDGNGATGIDYPAIWFSNTDLPTKISTFFDAGSGWVPIAVGAISDTGYISGGASHLVPGSTTQYYTRSFTMLIPKAGTYGLGDANFDTKVNFDDLIILAQHYNQSNASKASNVGDFNLDGFVNFDDLISLAQNYNKTGAGSVVAANESFAADWAVAQSLVPEPTFVGVAFCVLAVCGTRAKRSVL